MRSLRIAVNFHIKYTQIFDSRSPPLSTIQTQGLNLSTYFHQIGQIQLAASMKVNITVQIDPGGELSAEHHFLTIPTYTMYEQRMAGSAAKIFVGSVESVTANFTVKEGKLPFFVSYSNSASKSQIERL